MIQGINTAWLLIVTAGLLSTVGNLCLKKASMASNGAGFIEMIFQPYFMCGCFFYGINVLLFSKALQTIDVSKAYPILAAVGFSTLAIMAAFVFRETLSITNYVGMFVIIAGISLVAL